MAISVVQTKTAAAASGSSLTVTLTSGTTAGNSIIVTVASFLTTGGVNPVVGVTLGGVSLTNAIQSEDVNGKIDNEIWFLDNIAGGATSIVITWAGTNTSHAAVAYEVSGLVKTGSTDVGNSNSNDASTSPLSWTSASSGTLNQASEIAVGTSAQGGTGTITPTGPTSPWVNTSASSTDLKIESGYNIVSATTALSYAGSTTFTSSINVNTSIVTFKAAGGVSVALTAGTVAIATPQPTPGVSIPLPVATVTIAAPAPALAAGPVALAVSTVTVAAPAPGLSASPMALSVAPVAIGAPSPALAVSVPLSVATVVIGTPAPFPQMSGVTLTTGTVAIAALPVAPVVGIVVVLPVATVTIATPAPSLAAGPVALSVATVGIAAPTVVTSAGPLALPVAAVAIATPAPTVKAGPVALPVATVAIAAPAPGLVINANVNLPVATVAISAPAPTPRAQVIVRLPVATVAVAALPVKVSRQLTIAIASQPGTDDYGNTFSTGVTVGPISEPQVAIRPSTGPGVASAIEFPVPEPALSNIAGMGMGSTSTLAALEMAGPALNVTGDKDYVQAILWSNDQLGHPARFEFRYIDTLGNVTIEGSYNSGGWTFNQPVAMDDGLDVSGGITADTVDVTINLTVNGTDIGATVASIISALSGASTSNNGLTDGTIGGTSGGASAGTAHTHGPGSFSVNNGHHAHTLPTV